MKIGVSTTPCGVCNRPRLARVFGSLVMSSNFISYKVAGCISAVFDLSQRRLIGFAAIDSNRAPCMKTTTGWRIDGRRNISAQDNALFLCGGIGNRDSTEQCLSVRMLRRSTDLLARSDFD